MGDFPYLFDIILIEILYQSMLPSPPSARKKADAWCDDGRQPPSLVVYEKTRKAAYSFYEFAAGVCRINSSAFFFSL
jgi:hypothetical protein